MENTEWRFNRIVVGVDGSAGAARALYWAIALAKRTGAQIVATYVAQPLASEVATMYGFVAPVTVPDWEDEVRGLFEGEWSLPLRRSGVPFRLIFEGGSPGPGLVEVAQREAAGLIVTGSRGLGGFRELIIGSVSHYVVQHADIPVVVVPPDRRAREHVAEPVEVTRAIPLPASAGVS
jgi:nucleotide-binding universal stress UspA family protein